MYIYIYVIIYIIYIIIYIIHMIYHIIYTSFLYLHIHLESIHWIKLGVLNDGFQ